MLIKTLFERNNVKCPEWLLDEELFDEWNDAEYYQENEVHKWRLITETGHSLISFNKKEYTFEAYDNNNELIFIKQKTKNKVNII